MNPLSWLDLRDARGKPDHQKVMPTILVFAAIALHAVSRPFGGMELVVLGALCFGPRMFGLYLRRANITLGRPPSHEEPK